MTLDIPSVSILLLGDAEVGKSTFLSRLTLGAHAQRTPSASSNETPPPYKLPTLRDLDQPFIFNITLYNRPYRFEFYDTASPQNYTLLKPDFIILCFDITRRSTLATLKGYWKELVEGTFNYDEHLPVMILGLKRDLRREWTEAETLAVRAMLDSTGGGSGKSGLGGGMGSSMGQGIPESASVMPQEGLRIAQEMRCDLYAECSALTGELCREVLQDIAKIAAKTTTEKGGRSEGSCSIM